MLDGYTDETKSLLLRAIRADRARKCRLLACALQPANDGAQNAAVQKPADLNTRALQTRADGALRARKCANEPEGLAGGLLANSNLNNQKTMPPLRARANGKRGNAVGRAQTNKRGAGAAAVDVAYILAQLINDARIARALITNEYHTLSDEPHLLFFVVNDCGRLETSAA